jgi:serine/threonine-protein kinase
MANVYLDSQARLGSFVAVPQQLEDPPPESKFDWSVLFAEAGLEISKFHETEPRWTPPRYSDLRAAWEGVSPGSQSIPIRVEAAAFHGKPVYFDIIYPWDRPFHQEQYQPSLQQKIRSWLTVGLLAAIVGGAALLGLRNIRHGRSDRNGAARLAMYTFGINVVTGLLTVHHVPALNSEFAILEERLAWALLSTITMWIVYLALEPFVRGRWPHRIISWKRFISGDFRDPLVGRDITLGILLGITAELIAVSWYVLPHWFGWPPPAPDIQSVMALSGLREQLSQMFSTAQEAPFVALSSMFVLLLLSIILRKEWLAAGVGWLVLATMIHESGVNLVFDFFLPGLCAALIIFGLMRFGLLTTAFAFLAILLLDGMPMTPNFSAWFAGATILVLVVLVGLSLWGAYTSLAGRAIFKARPGSMSLP